MRYLLGGGPGGATVPRYELVSKDGPAPGKPLLAHDIALDPSKPSLMALRPRGLRPWRGGAAAAAQGRRHPLPAAGHLALCIEGEPDRVIKPGQAWFESGREPVYARASATEPTSFVRCSILPHEIRGQSSIMCVDPKDAGSKACKYTVFVDEPIELPR